MTLGFERFADSLDTKGVLGVDLIVALERVPIRRDAFAALPSHLVVTAVAVLGQALEVVELG